MSQIQYKYGEIYWVEFDEETVGTELKGRHPAVIISDNWYNEEGERVVALPCSSSLKKVYPFEVLVKNLANNGKDGKVMVDQIKGIDKERLIDSAINCLNQEQLNQVNRILAKICRIN